MIYSSPLTEPTPNAMFCLPRGNTTLFLYEAYFLLFQHQLTDPLPLLSLACAVTAPISISLDGILMAVNDVTYLLKCQVPFVHIPPSPVCNMLTLALTW